MILFAAGVITASEPSWTAPFTGLSPRSFGKLLTVLRCQDADVVRKGRPWSLPLEDRALLVAVYWRTNLTMRQLAPLFGVSKSAADRITRWWRCRRQDRFAVPRKRWSQQRGEVLRIARDIVVGSRRGRCAGRPTPAVWTARPSNDCPEPPGPPGS